MQGILLLLFPMGFFLCVAYFFFFYSEPCFRFTQRIRLIMILLKITRNPEAKPAFLLTTQKEKILQMVYAGITFTFVHTSELLCFLRITQSEHMWNIATSLHCLINQCRQKNAGGRKASVRVFHLVTAKSGNSTPLEQQMPVRLGNTLLNECASCVKYQILILNVFGHNLKVSIL